MILELPEPPSANRYWRHAKGRTYLSADALAYRDTVTAAWATYRVRDRKTFRRMRGPIALTYAWYRKIAAGDLDNRTKQLCDALRGHAYEDDSQIVEIHAYRYDSPKSGQVVVTIEAAPQQES